MRLFRAMLASAAATMAAAYVPPHMELPASWTDVSTGTLIPLEFKSETWHPAASALEGDDDSSTATVLESTCMTAENVIRQHSGKNGCIVFAVRRPGWALCREEGKAIADLAAREDKSLDGFGIFGIVKEVGVDDEGLTEFQSDFFPYPMYRDEEKTFYAALGLRKLKAKSWNPYKIFKGIRGVMKRLKEKEISGNMVGEGLVQGGIIIFDKTGKARYAYREETGFEVPVDDIVAAVKMVKSESA